MQSGQQRYSWLGLDGRIYLNGHAVDAFLDHIDRRAVVRRDVSPESLAVAMGRLVAMVEGLLPEPMVVVHGRWEVAPGWRRVNGYRCRVAC